MTHAADCFFAAFVWCGQTCLMPFAAILGVVLVVAVLITLVGPPDRDGQRGPTVFAVTPVPGQ